LHLHAKGGSVVEKTSLESMPPVCPAVSLVTVACRGKMPPNIVVVAIPPPVSMRLELLRIRKRSIASRLLDLADDTNAINSPRHNQMRLPFRVDAMLPWFAEPAYVLNFPAVWYSFDITHLAPPSLLFL
jgi:hypothetical protein